MKIKQVNNNWTFYTLNTNMNSVKYYRYRIHSRVHPYGNSHNPLQKIIDTLCIK